MRLLLAAGGAARGGWAPVVEGGVTAAAVAPRGESLRAARSRLGGSVAAAAAAAVRWGPSGARQRRWGRCVLAVAERGEGEG